MLLCARSWLCDIRGSGASLVHVTVASQRGRLRRKGIRIHRTRRLNPTEVTSKDGIPVTTVARTLLDLADVLSKQALKRAIDESEYQRLFDLTALTAVVNANPGRRSSERPTEPARHFKPTASVTAASSSPAIDPSA